MKKKRNLSKFDDEEAFFAPGGDTTTEARNAKANASSRMPFSGYGGGGMQLMSDEEGGNTGMPHL
jgi:hypothetical protein